jgi:hypothetical protein
MAFSPPFPCQEPGPTVDVAGSVLGTRGTPFCGRVVLVGFVCILVTSSCRDLLAMRVLRRGGAFAPPSLIFGPLGCTFVFRCGEGSSRSSAISAAGATSSGPASIAISLGSFLIAIASGSAPALLIVQPVRSDVSNYSISASDLVTLNYQSV